MAVQDYFSKVEDTRIVGRCKHKLSNILVIALARAIYEEMRIMSPCMNFA